MARCMRVSLASLLLGLAVCTPARADILGTLVNEVMEGVLSAFSQPQEKRSAERPSGVPDDALEGRMSPPRGKLVEIDGKSMRLSPGSKIRGKSNRIVLPSTITSPVDVLYTVDASDQIHSVWILSER